MTEQIPQLKQIIEKAQHYAFAHQHPEGYWWGEISSNSTMEAEQILLYFFLGMRDHPDIPKLVNQILNTQRPDGTWCIYYGAPGDLSTTVECYFALKLIGHNTNSERMILARNFILAKGGVEKTRIFTKLWLALFGQWPWDGLPLLIPEIIFLPSWFPLNIYEFGTWARASIIPITLTLIQRPICQIAATAQIDELFSFTKTNKAQQKLSKPKNLFSWQEFFWIIDKLLHAYEKFPWKPGRKKTIKKIENYILTSQQADGGWGGIQPATVYSLIALKTLGYDTHSEIFTRCFEGIKKSFTFEFPTEIHIQATNSPVWDTCLMMNALLAYGINSDNVNIQKAAEWLLAKQIKSPGDWQIKNPNTPPGGWAFEFANDYYPDIDDTAEVLLALNKCQLTNPEAEKLRVQAIESGTEWILSMQSSNGGWAGFDIDCTNYFLSKIAFFDFGDVLDPPSVDVTAHVLEALMNLDYSTSLPLIKKAIKFIYSEQEADGSWVGRWGVNYLYGTVTSLIGLQKTGEDLTQPCLQKAISWLIEKQNSDGGWGESCASYVDKKQAGKGPSTASQTAWVLLALMNCGKSNSKAVADGIKYLCNTQLPNGTWDEKYYTGTGSIAKRSKTEKIVLQQGTELSAAIMLYYEFYKLYWPLQALGTYAKLNIS